MPLALSKEPLPVKVVPISREEERHAETVAQVVHLGVGVEVARPLGVILRDFGEEVDGMRMPVGTFDLVVVVVAVVVVFTVTTRVLVRTDFRVSAVGGTADTGGRLRYYVATDGRVLEEHANLGHGCSVAQGYVRVRACVCVTCVKDR